MTFLDRRDAGRQLAMRLAHCEAKRPIVLGLPCWGAVVGYEIAHALGAPLDVVVARRIQTARVPRSPFGAVAEGGTVFLDRDLIGALGLSTSAVDAMIAREQQAVEHWAIRFRGCRSFVPVAGSEVFVVDDGAALGHRACAAVRAVRAHAPARIVMAVPVIASAAIALLRPEVDELVYLDAPPTFLKVNYWYARCGRTTDEQVEGLLQAARHELAGLRPTAAS